MRVFIDTNILVSAMLFKNSKAYIGYEKLVRECESFISNKTIDELRKVFNNKFQDKIQMLDIFIAIILKSVHLVEDTDISYPLENTIRDKKDIFIYRNAKYLNCDAIITGDKDFLENTQLDIKVISISEYLDMP